MCFASARCFAAATKLQLLDLHKALCAAALCLSQLLVREQSDPAGLFGHEPYFIFLVYWMTACRFVSVSPLGKDERESPTSLV